MDKYNSKQLEEDNESLFRLKKNGTSELENIYKNNRLSFIKFAQRYALEEMDILDVYQDTIIAFYENVVGRKITKFDHSLRTYLFSIGKYKIYDLLKKRKKSIPLKLQEQEVIFEIKKEEELTHRQQFLKNAILNLGKKCRQVLQLFYYKKYSIEAIKTELKYKDDNVVKAHKSRCLKSLRTFISKDDIY